MRLFLFVCLLLLGALALLADEALVDMRDDAAARDRRLDERVQLLVAADGKLEMARRDTLHLQVLGRVAGQLEHLGREVFQDGGRVDGGGGAHAAVRRRAVLEVTVDTTDGELKAGPGRPRDGLRLGLSRVLSGFASCHFFLGSVEGNSSY